MGQLSATSLLTIWFGGLLVVSVVVIFGWLGFCYLVEKFPPVTVTKDKALMRCNCGALFWNNDQEKLQRHAGHHMGYAKEGSHWEMFKVKMGWL